MDRWQRNFLAMWPSLFVVSMGMMAVLPTLSFYVEERFGLTDPDDVRFWTGLAYGAAPLAAAICGPIWGVLGDRIGRKPMALRALLAISVAMALMPLAEAPWMLVALRALQGMFSGYVAPAMALVSADVPTDRQGRVLSKLQVGLALGLLVGPWVGAEVAAAYSRTAVFYVTSACGLAAAVPVMLFAKEAPMQPRPAGDERLLADMLHGFGKVLAEGRLFVVFLSLLFLMRLGQQSVEPYVALLVRALGPLPWFDGAVAGPAGGVAAAVQVGVDRSVAWFFLVLAVGQIVFTPLWGRLADRVGPLRCLAAISLALGLLYVGVSWTESTVGFFTLRCVMAIFTAGTMTLAYAAATRRVPSDRRTLAFAMVQSCLLFGMAFGPSVGDFALRHAIADRTTSAPGEQVPAAETARELTTLFAYAGAVLIVTGLAMIVLRVLHSKAVRRHGSMESEIR